MRSGFCLHQCSSEERHFSVNDMTMLKQAIDKRPEELHMMTFSDNNVECIPCTDNHDNTVDVLHGSAFLGDHFAGEYFVEGIEKNYCIPLLQVIIVRDGGIVGGYRVPYDVKYNPFLNREDKEACLEDYLNILL